MSYTRPGSVNELPKGAQFEQPKKFELIINLKARQIDPTVPPTGKGGQSDQVRKHKG
jgi:hypothetical protein